jgi:hypothetical protein
MYPKGDRRRKKKEGSVQLNLTHRAGHMEKRKTYQILIKS